MEGSSSGTTTPVSRADPKACFERAGLPVKSAVAWHKSGLRVTGNFKRDAATGSKYWRAAVDLIAKLPAKPKRSAEQKLAADTIISACREAREDFLQRHAEAVYRKLTKNLTDFVRVDELAYDAGKLIPGFTPMRQQVAAEY